MAKAVEKSEDSMKMVEAKAFIDDSIALKSHLIFQNDERYEFEKGKLFSETNTVPIPERFKITLQSEGIIKGDK